MELMQAIEARHSVRRYTDQTIEASAVEALRQRVEECNRQSGLHIQLCLNQPQAFSGAMAGYGNFSNVSNYVALVGKKGSTLDEKCGYYGENLVLLAQQLGLNTCWVALTYNKKQTQVQVARDEKLLMVIALGYGETQGKPRKSKAAEELFVAKEPPPPWFLAGIKAAQLAPTAVNQQKFSFALAGNTVTAKPGLGFYTKVDLGIAKYHFEAGAGQTGWQWA